MKACPLLLLAVLTGPVLPGSNLQAAGKGREYSGNLYERGRQAFHHGDLVTAKDAFSKVLKAKPDFDLAQIYMAQIRLAEEKWAARPRSQKIAEVTAVDSVALRGVALADALEVVRRQVEKAATGPQAGPVEMITAALPREGLEKPVEMTVRDVPMTHFIQAVAFAGAVEIRWHDRGLEAVPSKKTAAAADPDAFKATDKMRQASKSQILPIVDLKEVSVRGALTWISQQSTTAQGPLLVAREPVSEVPLTLHLRNVSVHDALQAVALVSGMEVSWHPWGAGLAPRQDVAAQ